MYQSSKKSLFDDVVVNNINGQLKIFCKYTILLFRRIEAQRRKERNEAHLYMDVQVLTEQAFCTWSGNDLFGDLKHTHFKIQKKEKLKDATRIIAESFVSLRQSFTLSRLVYSL